MKFNFNEEILDNLYDSDNHAVVLLGYDETQNVLSRIVVDGSLEKDKPLRLIQVWLLSRDYNDFYDLPKHDSPLTQVQENTFVIKDCLQLYKGILDWVDIQVSDDNPLYAALLTETAIETNDIGYDDLIAYTSKYVEDITEQLKNSTLMITSHIGHYLQHH